MSKKHDALRRKFAVLRGAVLVPLVTTKAKQAASGSKGLRRRITLRLSASTARDLRLLKLALAADVNGLCEEFLAKAAAEKLASVKANAKPGEWDAILRCVQSRTG